jgi:FtsZ-interacting cell division protein ZipA
MKISRVTAFVTGLWESKKESRSFIDSRRKRRGQKLDEKENHGSLVLLKNVFPLVV